MDAATLETLRQIELGEILNAPIRLSNSPLRRRLERALLIKGDVPPTIDADEVGLRDRRRWFLTEIGRKALNEVRVRPATWRHSHRRPELALPDLGRVRQMDMNESGAVRQDILAWCWLVILTASSYAGNS